MKEDLKTIINHYGINNQQRKLAEEVFELQEAITMYENITYFDIENIIEELADCFVLLKQIMAFYEIDEETLYINEKYKINRQLERIKNGE